MGTKMTSQSALLKNKFLSLRVFKDLNNLSYPHCSLLANVALERFIEYILGLREMV